MQIKSIRQRLRELGALPLHEQRVLRDWVQGRPHDHGRRRADDFLPKALRAALPEIDGDLHGLARLISSHPTEDGAARLLVGLADGQTVESVLLPRDGVCVSSQVGCAVGCRFCIQHAKAQGRLSSRWPVVPGQVANHLEIKVY